MERYEVRTIYGKTDKDYVITAKVPGSKSITNRALLIAALANGKTELKGVLFSDDSRHFIDCVEKLGIELDVNEADKTVSVMGLGGKFTDRNASLNVGSAGTAARFLSAALGAVGGKYYLDASEQMKKRPMAPLLDALTELGCRITFGEKEGHFPFTIESAGFDKNRISVNIDKSSQFLSALLISSVASGKEMVIDVTGSHGMAYADMTVRMMEQFGVTAQKNVESINDSDQDGSAQTGSEKQGSCRGLSYKIPGNVSYKAHVYDIEPDASAAAYFYAMCPLLNAPAAVPGIRRDSLQGDVGFLDILVRMGCELKEYGELSGEEKSRFERAVNCSEDETRCLERSDDSLESNKDGLKSDKDGLRSNKDAILSDEDLVLFPPSNGVFHGIDVDMSACSDQAITLAAIAPFADSPTTITGIGHIRLQESDRLSAIETELRRMGIRTESGEDYIRIYPGLPKAAVVQTYSDHRMAMGFSLIGLRAEGVIIDDPMCCAKTFEEYFKVLDTLSLRVLSR